MREKIQQAKDNLPPNSKLIYLARTGSKLYGTDTEKSDEDFRGVYITHNNSILVREPKVSVQITPDFQMIEIGHFVNLMSRTSPNTIETLLIDSKDIIYFDEAFEEILNNQEIYLTEGYVRNIKFFAQSLWKKKDSNKSIAHTYRLYVLLLNLLKGKYTNKLTKDEREEYLKIRNYKGVIKDVLPLMEWAFDNINRIGDKHKIPENHSKEFYEELLLKIRLDYGNWELD